MDSAPDFSRLMPAVSRRVSWTATAMASNVEMQKISTVSQPVTRATRSKLAPGAARVEGGHALGEYLDVILDIFQILVDMRDQQQTAVGAPQISHGRLTAVISPDVDDQVQAEQRQDRNERESKPTAYRHPATSSSHRQRLKEAIMPGASASDNPCHRAPGRRL